MRFADDEQVTAEPGIPMPQRQTFGTYPWRDMNVGDSFEYPHRLASAYTQASIWSKKLGRKFAVRSNPADRFIVRIWRTA